MVSKYRRFLTEKETAYIRRVAGKAPAWVIARQIKRKEKDIFNWGSRNHVSLRVPSHIMNKYWRGHGAKTGQV